MKSSRAWITYSIVRLLAFLIPFGIIMLVLPDWQWNWAIGLLVGTVVGLSVSVIFLRAPSARIGEQIQQSRANKKPSGPRPIDLEEDADLDGQA